MVNCLFCDIVANTTPSYTVYEDEFTRAFLDIFPSTTGHVVVILKKHGWTILDYTPEELSHLMASVQKVVRALTLVYTTEVFTLGVNHKEEQGVHHLHVHVLPRFPEDGGGVIQSIVETEVKEPLPTIAQKIKKAIV
jgi:histidine triad (HIT) family protein